MATNFPQALGTAAPQSAQWVNPYDALVEEQRKRLQAMQAQPLYTPDQQQQRVEQNERDYNAGVMLQMLAGMPQANELGGMVLKQALSDRAPRVSERGTADPLRGTFQYNPEYTREREETQLSALEQRRAAAEADQARRSEERAFREWQTQQTLQNQQLLKTMGVNAALGVSGFAGQATVVGSTGPEDGNQPIFRGKTGQLFTYDPVSGQPKAYAGPIAPKPTSSTATEDERKAAGWYNQASLAYKNMQAAIGEDPAAAKLGPKEKALTYFPKVGDDLAYAQMSPARQKFTTAASEFSEAVLRAATGAGVNESEAKQKIAALTPRFGEHPSSVQMKEAAMRMYLDSLLARAGRAAPTGAAAKPGASAAGGADPLGLR